MNPENLFEEYLKSGVYLRGWSPKTAQIYRRAWKSFTRYQQSLQGPTPGPQQPDSTGGALLSKAQLEAWVISRREAGMSPSGINMYIRAMNSFNAWLKEEGHTEQQIVLKQLKAPTKAIQVFDSKDISLILSFKPRGFYEFRTWVMLQLLLDTGCRINEILTLKESNVDFDNMLLTVLGKGSKERRIPFSQEVRKSLWRYKNHKNRKGIYFFSTRDGVLIRYRNIYRDILKLCKDVGITKHVHVHLTRHSFACHFMKNGGSIYTLSRILGHSSVSTTQIYIRGLGVEDFQEEHARLSPLARR